MQKKLIVVAVAGALSAPALVMAQSSTVQIYGRITGEYSYVDRGAGTTKGDLLQTPGGSSIGFKGEEKLGGGLSAWFQCESSADVQEGGDGTCTRNSAIGFKGAFGNVYIGRWDTPWKKAFSMGDGVGSEDTGVQGNTRLTVGSSTGQIGVGNRGIWKRRQANTINYDTPKMGGFHAEVSYSSLEASGINTVPGTATAKPRLWSIAGLYRAGPLGIGIGYEKHDDFGGAGLDDKAWAIGARYKFGKVLVGGSYNKQDYDGPAGASMDRKAWTVGVEFNINGPHNIEASYTDTGDTKGTIGFTPSSLLPAVSAAGNNGAKQWQLAYRHVMSKRTEARIAYVVVDNDSGTNIYSLNGVSSSPNPPTGTLGEKQTGISLLVKHRF